MKARGEVSPPVEHSVEVDLPDGFWDDAEIVRPRPRKSVHLRVDADVFEFFSRQGKGHISRMQAVLRSYVDAQTRK
jgi:uncharacterized protein (DUF4415 family)